jgi:hypothetical protein
MRDQQSKPMWITDDPGWRRVRFNRRRVIALMIAGPAGFIAGFQVLAHSIQPAYFFPWGMVLLTGPSLVFMVGFMFFLQGTHFLYDIHSFAVKGQDPLGFDSIRRWRRGGPSLWSPDKEIDYPEPGFDRLDYSVAYAEIYAVRPDGPRKRLWMRARWAEPEDWEAFVGHLRRIGALDDAA